MRPSKLERSGGVSGVILVVGLLVSCSSGCGSGSSDTPATALTMREMTSSSASAIASAPVPMSTGDTYSGVLVDGVREVRVTAARFQFTPAEIVVRHRDRVRLRVTSQDVTHGLDLVAFRIGAVFPPHQEKVMEFVARRIGRFRGHCSVYCGSGHEGMSLVVRVDPAE